MKRTLLAMALLMAACGTGTATTSTTGASIDPTTPSPPRQTTTTAPPTTSSSTTSTTATTTTPGAAMLVDPGFIGVWPYRTTDEVLAAAVDGIHVNELELVEAFLTDRTGWTMGPVVDSRDGTDFMALTIETPEGQFYVGTRIVGYSPAGDAVVAIDYASSLDFLEDGWGPSTDVGESEDGWSVLVNATPITKLTSRPGVSGPYAQIAYGEWQSEWVLIRPVGASISIPFPPDTPGVLSIWYTNGDGSVAGFSIMAVPAGPFAAG